MTKTKDELFEEGKLLIASWCVIHSVKPPEVIAMDGPQQFGTCAYYRSGTIFIWVHHCASIGLSGRQWSYPGYIVDRTPYGVLAHELGHHVDHAHGPRGGTRSHDWRPFDPEPLTGYCPDDNEWFAELFRLFITNPHLLRLVRPITYERLSQEFPRPVELNLWHDVLAGSERHLRAAENKIATAAKQQRKSGHLFR